MLLHELERMERAPLKPGVHDTSSLAGWLLNSLPTTKALVSALLASVIIGAACASFVYRPIDLTPAEDRLKQESSAQRQFALAITSPQSAAKWEAVFEYFPKTDEAYWARVHLGAWHLARQPAELNEAKTQFTKLMEETSFKKDDQKEVRILATIGEALVAHLRDDSETRDAILEKRLMQEHPDLDELNLGPRDLRQFLSNQMYGVDNRRPPNQ